jgi:putative tricarboxylic transport membrane protein
VARSIRWPVVAIGAGTVLLAGVVAREVLNIPGDAVYARVGPQAIPWVVAAMLAVLGAALAIQGFLGGGADEAGDAHGSIDRAGVLWLLAGLALNVALIDRAGFIIAATALFVCTARAFRSTAPVRDAAIGVALALVSYVGFDRVLGYKIGSGLIERLL